MLEVSGGITEREIEVHNDEYGYDLREYRKNPERFQHTSIPISELEKRLNELASGNGKYDHIILQWGTIERESSCYHEEPKHFGHTRITHSPKGSGVEIRYFTDALNGYGHTIKLMPPTSQLFRVQYKDVRDPKSEEDHKVGIVTYAGDLCVNITLRSEVDTENEEGKTFMEMHDSGIYLYGFPKVEGIKIFESRARGVLRALTGI